MAYKCKQTAILLVLQGGKEQAWVVKYTGFEIQLSLFKPMVLSYSRKNKGCRLTSKILCYCMVHTCEGGVF